MSEVAYVPAGELLQSLELIPLPENSTPLEALVLVKALDEEGNISWYVRETETLLGVEAIGILAVTHAGRLQEQVNGFIFLDDEDDDDEDGY